MLRIDGTDLLRIAVTISIAVMVRGCQDITNRETCLKITKSVECLE